MKFSTMKLEFSNKLNKLDPVEDVLFIVGPKSLLAYLTYEDVKHKMGSITKQRYEEVSKLIQNSCHEAVSLHLRNASIARLPNVCSRNNTPSQSHSLTRLVKSYATSKDGHILVVCEYNHVFASACAIARAYPLFSRKQEKEMNSIVVEFVVMNEKGEKSTLSDNDIACLNVAGEGVRMAGRIADTPCSEMHTDAFLEEIKKIGADLNITPTIIRGDELQKQGFGGVYCVGKAAVNPPALAILSHKPPGATQDIAWVGKGIVYDTGGLSIKHRTSMCGMKRDCAGAAAVLGAFNVAVRAGFTENLHAVFCLAENAVGPSAVRPDDIVTMYSTKTVEISNTDAEGRVVLADGVAYAKKDLKANTIVVLATLTGAQGSTTGKMHGAVLSDTEEWEIAAVKAGKASGDLVFPVVYAPELHFSEFNSQVADMKNSVSDTSNAAVSCGGLFINNHVGFDFDGNFIHFDISKVSHSSERATGFGVALFNTLFGHLSSCDLLNTIAPKTFCIGCANGEK